MLDALLIFVLVLAGVLEMRRGTMLASFDLTGSIFGFSAAQFWYMGFGIFLKNALGLSPTASTIMAALLIWLFVFFIFFGIGFVVHGMTLLTLGDPFESIVGFIFGALSSGTLLRFILILVMSFTQNQGIKDAITDSWIGNELYTLSTYNYYMQQLEPLRNPGEIYI